MVDTRCPDCTVKDRWSDKRRAGLTPISRLRSHLLRLKHLASSRETGRSQWVDATLCLKGEVKWMQGKQKKKRRKRREFTAAELAEVWDRWERGESSKAIAGALDRGTVYYLLLRYGGIRPRARCRSARALTLAEREEISRGIASGQSLRTIARVLNRSPSTLSREI
jgi:hypothetical protein